MPKNGKTTRHGNLHTWSDRKHRVFLVPNTEGNEDTAVCFQFDKGLRKAMQPWTDSADLERGLELARTLLLPADVERADNRHG